MFKNQIKRYTLSESSLINDAIKKLNSFKNKILIILKKNNDVIGVLTEGDINKALDRGLLLDDKIKRVINKNFIYIQNEENLTKFFYKKLHHDILHVPLIKNKKLKKIYFYEEIVNKINKNYLKKNYKTLIMAGGFGKRMGSVSISKPKALLKDLNGKPIIINMIEFIKRFTKNNIYVSVFYKKKIIKKRLYNYFNKNINFLNEIKPLGTIGCVKNIHLNKNEKILVINCDTKIKINPNIIIDYHDQNKNDLTIAGSLINNKIEYGIFKINKKNKLVSFREKPSTDHLVNLGIYVINKKVQNLIPKNKRFDANQLIDLCLKKNLKIKILPLHRNMWTDIGTKDKYLTYLKNEK